jgi:hypothetical protein
VVVSRKHLVNDNVDSRLTMDLLDGREVYQVAEGNLDYLTSGRTMVRLAYRESFVGRAWNLDEGRVGNRAIFHWDDHTSFVEVDSYHYVSSVYRSINHSYDHGNSGAKESNRGDRDVNTSMTGQ